eukprot:1201543-Prymnesium_polylepis.1
MYGEVPHEADGYTTGSKLFGDAVWDTLLTPTTPGHATVFVRMPQLEAVPAQQADTIPPSTAQRSVFPTLQAAAQHAREAARGAAHRLAATKARLDMLLEKEK